MTESCAENRAHSVCKDCTDMDARESKRKGVSTNNMEENDTGGDEECC